jgi:hypothetical protein
MQQKTCYTTVNKKFEEFMVNEQRYNIIWGGASSGKSQAAAQKVIKRCITEVGTKEQPFCHAFTVFRKYGTTVLGSVFAQIRDELRRMGIDDLVTINPSYHNFKFWNGAEIRCIGLDDPEKLKSIFSTAAWVEEATELEEADWTQLDLRYRGKSQYYYQLILTFNPIDESHWIKRQFFDTTQGGLTYTLHTTYMDNFFTDAQYKQVLADRYSFDPNLNRVYVLGQWGKVKTGSEFFFNFRYDRHVKDVKYVNQMPIHISIDFNVNPYISATVSQIIKREIPDGSGGVKPYFFINVLDEFALPNPYNTSERLCEEIIIKYRYELKYGVYLYGDASGKTRDTRSNVTDWDIVESSMSKYLHNYSMRVPKANPLVRKRRWFINKLLFGGFNMELSIDQKCKKTILDFQSLIEAMDGSVQKQVKRDPKSQVIYELYGHHSDTVTYMICEAFSTQFENFM